MKIVKLIDLPIEWKRGTGLRKSDVTINGNYGCILYGELFTKHKNVLIDGNNLSRTNNTGTVSSKKGDVLIPGTSTASRNDMLLAREVDTNGILIGGDINIIRPKDGLFARKYLAYFFDTLGAHQQIEKYITGTTGIIHLSNSGIKNSEIPLFSIDEQQRIVKILDEVFENITKAKENAEKNLANAKELFESYLQSVFAKPGKDWKEKSLEDLGKITSSKRIYRKEYVKDGIPFYRIKEIKELAHNKNITLELYISKRRYKEIKDIFGVPLVGDILMTAVGTIGEIYVVKNDDEFYFKDGNILWFKNFNSVDPHFLKFVLMSFVEQINKLSKGSAYSALTIEKIKKHRIFLPKSISEQKSIVSKLDALSAETKKLESIYKQKIADLDELKKLILQKAFAGEL